MDRINGAGHVGNRFVAEDLATNRPPTEITPEWMNSVQEELVAVATLNGEALNPASTTQARDAIVAYLQGRINALVNASPAALDTLKELAAAMGDDPNFATTITNSLATKATQAGVQGQTYTGFTTAGAAPIFTLTPSPAIAAYAAGQRFRVKFHATGAGSDVLNISTLGNKSLKQYDRAGAKVAAVIIAGQLTDVEYDGVDFVILAPLPSVGGQQIFTAGGNFTVPAGVSRAFVSLVGGGGGGAGAINGAPYTSGGGGSGGVKYRNPIAVTPGQVIAVTIGTGGAGGLGSGSGGTYSTSAGSAGGTTSFGALLSVPGGSGGTCGNTSAYGGGAGHHGICG